MGFQRQPACSCGRTQEREAGAQVFSSTSVIDSFCDLEQFPSPLILNLTTSQRYQKSPMKSQRWKHFAKQRALYKCEKLLSKQISCQHFWYHSQDLLSFHTRSLTLVAPSKSYLAQEQEPLFSPPSLLLPASSLMRPADSCCSSALVSPREVQSSSGKDSIFYKHQKLFRHNRTMWQV